jgi:hypothetical protein
MSQLLRKVRTTLLMFTTKVQLETEHGHKAFHVFTLIVVLNLQLQKMQCSRC